VQYVVDLKPCLTWRECWLPAKRSKVQCCIRRFSVSKRKC